MNFLFSRIKTYGLAIAVAVAGVIAVIARLLLTQNSRLRHRAENAEAKARRAVIVATADQEIEKSKRKIRDEIKNTGPDDGFKSPGSLWSRRDDS